MVGAERGWAFNGAQRKHFLVKSSAISTLPCGGESSIVLLAH